MANSFKKFWDWLWKSDSWMSYVVFLLIIFVVIKFLFLPALGFVFHAQDLPLAIVESSSMDHRALNLNGAYYELCGSNFDKQKSFSLEEYWQTCGEWYEKNVNISKEQFSEFSFKNGFRKGDIMLIWGWKKPEIGEVVVFAAGDRHPIIHRIISLSENNFATKGDHNSGQLTSNVAPYVDETNINKDRIIGVAVARIPYVGWMKIFFVEHTLLFIFIVMIIILIYFAIANLKNKIRI